MRITCLGDSLAFGHGVPRKNKWLVLAQKSLPDTVLLNAGICGDTTNGMKRRLRNVLGTRPDGVILIGGINDILLTGSDKEALSNMDALAAACKQLNVVPYLAISPPVYSGDAMDWFTDPKEARPIALHYAQGLRDLANAKAYPLIDFAEAGDWHQADMYIDGFHPSPKGHQAMAKMVVSTLQDTH